MKAIVIREPGGPDVLELRDVPDPEPVRGEVRVAVRASAVNRADVLQRMGAYPAPPGSPKDIPGLEYSGVVDALGEGVTDFAMGDRVFGIAGGGAYAEKIVLPARTVARMPERLSFEEGAAVPEAFLTAYDAFVQAHLRPGERVLVSACGSGVGTAAAQIAAALGARPFGTARTREKIARAKTLGLTDGVVPENGRFADAVTKNFGAIDVVIELVGGAYVSEDLACLAPRGRIVLVGLVGGASADVALGALLQKRATIVGTVLRARPLEEKILAARMLERELAPLFTAGKLTPVIDRVLPLARAREAHEAMQKNETFGKLVLKVQ
ncbi:MAG TPA: NAD(P)H-quinone oxidoreductase [Polyangiaceae bacterium]|jgi:putative PIG3 family NAD(P)H quinone oxidoreductase